MSVVLVIADEDVLLGSAVLGGEVRRRHVVAIGHRPPPLAAIFLRLKGRRDLSQRTLAVPLDRLRGRGTPVFIRPPLVLVRHADPSLGYLSPLLTASLVWKLIYQKENRLSRLSKGEGFSPSVDNYGICRTT